MPRPTKFEDLTAAVQKGPNVATFGPSCFLSLPRKALIRVLKTLESLDACAADGLLDKEGSTDTGETIAYYLRPTDADRKRKLSSAQGEWDRTKKRYEDALEDAASVPGWMHWLINQWAEAEGKPTIQWPDTESN